MLLLARFASILLSVGYLALQTLIVPNASTYGGPNGRSRPALLRRRLERKAELSSSSSSSFSDKEHTPPFVPRTHPVVDPVGELCVLILACNRAEELAASLASWSKVFGVARVRKFLSLDCVNNSTGGVDSVAREWKRHQVEGRKARNQEPDHNVFLRGSVHRAAREKFYPEFSGERITHHWLSALNNLFSLEETPCDHVLYAEEDHLVAPSILFDAQQLLTFQNQLNYCPDCFTVQLGCHRDCRGGRSEKESLKLGVLESGNMGVIYSKRLWQGQFMQPESLQAYCNRRGDWDINLLQHGIRGFIGRSSLTLLQPRIQHLDTTRSSRLRKDFGAIDEERSGEEKFHNADISASADGRRISTTTSKMLQLPSYASTMTNLLPQLAAMEEALKAHGLDIRTLPDRDLVRQYARQYEEMRAKSPNLFRVPSWWAREMGEIPLREGADREGDTVLLRNQRALQVEAVDANKAAATSGEVLASPVHSEPSHLSKLLPAEVENGRIMSQPISRSMGSTTEILAIAPEGTTMTSAASTPRSETDKDPLLQLRIVIPVSNTRGTLCALLKQLAGLIPASVFQVAIDVFFTRQEKAFHEFATTAASSTS
ncbi:unnamed protein product, partial [Amoebophrya sp. A120]|eukprot:GSA120T00012700001.1